MAIRKIDGVWYADIRYHKKRYRWRSPQNTAPGARAYENYLRGELAARGSLDHLDPKKQAKVKREISLAEYAASWLAGYVAGNNKPSEQLAKRRILDHDLLPAFGTTSLPEITTANIENYKAKKRAAGLHPKTINNHLTVLRTCLACAVGDCVLSEVPRFKLLKAKRPSFRFLSQEEANRLIQAAPAGTVRSMIVTALYTGLRISELMALRWSDVDFTSGAICVERALVNGILGTPKNDRIRYVPLRPEVIEALGTVTGRSGVVFRITDNPDAYDSARWQIKVACRRAGLRPFGWHVLRHTFASWLVMAGAPLKAVQELMGHSTIEMTMRYAHLSRSALHDAVALLGQRVESVGMPAGRSYSEPHSAPPLTRSTDAGIFAPQTKNAA